MIEHFAGIGDGRTWEILYVGGATVRHFAAVSYRIFAHSALRVDWGDLRSDGPEDGFHGFRVASAVSGVGPGWIAGGAERGFIFRDVSGVKAAKLDPVEALRRSNT